MRIKINKNAAERALLEMIYNNPLRHDGHAYELRLALWGLGMGARPNPNDFGQTAANYEALLNYAIEMAKPIDEDGE